MVRLTVEKPKHPPEAVSFDAPAEVTVGRSADCTYCLDFDPLVSRMHAVIIVDPPSVRIKDLNSTNGLVINGEVYGAVNNQRLIQPLELRDGDEIFIGQTRFSVGVVDAGMDLGPELAKIKAEQAAADAELKAETGGDPMATMTDVRFSGSGRFRPGDVAARRVMGAGAAGRGRESYETVADLAAVCPDIPGYRVERFLAAGRTGNIYKAHAAADGRAVILKVATPPGGAFARKIAEDFRRAMDEMRGLSRGDAGIAELIAFGDMALSTLYTVSEFIKGENLASYLGRCPGNRLPVPVAFSLLRQMARAICHLHANNVVHRDIHAGGIMLRDDKGKLRAKFTEIGLTRFWIENELAGHGGRGVEIGRLGSTAPEELAQPGEAKASSDVFSLGCIFYQMTTGRAPYEFGDGTDARRVVEECRIRPIEELAPGLPETVVVIVERALAPDPDMRYPSACEMLEALENITM